MKKKLKKEIVVFLFSFVCYCSKDRYAGGLVSLGKAELNQIITEDKGAEIVCHFCNEKYHFTEAELNDLLSNM